MCNPNSLSSWFKRGGLGKVQSVFGSGFGRHQKTCLMTSFSSLINLSVSTTCGTPIPRIMSDVHTPPNHQPSPTNESADEEHRSIDKRYRFWKHPSEGESEVVKGELTLGRTADEPTKRKKPAPGKMTLGYGFTLSESPVRCFIFLRSFRA